MIGTRLSNRYELTGELGRGGMGAVYRARDPLLGRDVAVKLIPPTLLTPDSEERFQREAQVVAQMDHPGIVSIYDIGRHDGSLFFVMPVVTGTSLRHLLRERSLSLGDILDLGIQIADALEYSHGRGVVHRDIKPENVMAERQAGSGLRVRVMDFGLARASTETRLTRTGTLVGTIAYLSPEQVAADGSVDGRSDLYSLGTMLWECLAGEPPFTGEMQAILYRIVHEQAPPLRSLGCDIAEEFEAIILACLAKDPKKRPASAAELALALRRHSAMVHESDRGRSVALSSTRTLSFARPTASPFVGRERELGTLQQRLNAALAGECQLAVIAGEPGVGKTRLVEELENLAQVRKVRVLHGRFVEQDRAFAYQGFCELIQDYFRSRDSSSSLSSHTDFSDLAADLVSLFPVLTEISDVRSAAQGDSKLGPAGEARKGEDRTYIFELLAKMLTRMGAGKPLVLVLEELHGADVSIDAFQYIVRRLGPTPTLLVGTYRTTEIDKRHAVVKLLDSFSGDRKFSHVLLGPLPPDEHRALLGTLVGGGSPSEDLARQLYDATEGNPFFTKELVRSLVETGEISRSQTGAWDLSGGTAIRSDALPATIQQAVEKRIERLPAEWKDLLSLASVVGKSFEYRDLEDLTEKSGGLEDSVDALVREGMLEEEREGRGERLSFTSGVVRDVLYSQISRRKRRSLHRKYGEILEKRFAGRLERAYPQLLLHFAEGDVPEKAVDFGLKQARKTLENFSFEDAIRVLRIALEFLEDDDWPGDRALEGEARLLLASAFRFVGQVDAAIREAGEAARVFEREGLADRIVSAQLLAAETAWQERRMEEARTWIERGLRQAGTSGGAEVRHRLLSLAATLANLRGDYDRAKDYADRMESLAPKEAERPREDVPRGGTLTVGLVVPITGIDPTNADLIEEIEIGANVFETLFTTDDSGNPERNLCTGWEVRDEGRSFGLSLRRDVRFSDGHPLDAEEVRRSIEFGIRSSATLCPAFAVIEGAQNFLDGKSERISGVTVRSDDQIEIRLDEPLLIFPSLMTELATAIVRRPDHSEFVIGTGAFRIASRSENRILLERNDSWRGAPAPVDAIEFRSSMSSVEMRNALVSGELDLARDLAPNDLDELLREPRYRSGFVEAPKRNSYFAVFNQASAVVADPRLRRALAGSAKAQELVWRMIGRLAQPAVGMIPPGVLGHDPGRRERSIGEEDARELVRLGAADAPIRLSASVHPVLQDRFGKFTAALFDQWLRLGVEVRIVTPTMEAYLATQKESAGVDVFVGRWIADYDDPDNFARGLFHTTTGFLRKFFCSPVSDALSEAARREPRTAAREELYRQFEKMLLDADAFIPLFHEVDYRIGGPRLRNLRLRSREPFVNYSEIGKGPPIGIPQRAPMPAGAGLIQVAMVGSLQSLDPSLCQTVEQSEVLPNVFETVTREVGGARVIPWLASEVHAEDGNRRFRIRLRDDVRFHDGRRLSARDVRFSWERLIANEKCVSRHLLSVIRGARDLISGRSRDLTGFRIVSSLEFVVELEFPLAFFPVLISYPAAAIVPEGTIDVLGSWRESTIGTGPYRVGSFEPGKSVELDRNPDYRLRGHPKNEGVRFRLGASPESILSDFRAGRLTLAQDLYPSDVEVLLHDRLLAGGFQESPSLSTYFIAFHTRHDWLDQVEALDGVAPRRTRDSASWFRRSSSCRMLPASFERVMPLLGLANTLNRRSTSLSREVPP